MATFGSWDQHVVSTSGGIFVAYAYDSDNHDPDYWCLARSTDGGKTFQIIYDGQQDGSVVSPPAIEADQAGNVYVIAPTYQTSNWVADPTLFYRFSASDNYADPLKVSLNIGSAGKFSTVYDPTRNLIDVLFWAYGVPNQPSFYSITTNGVVSKRVDLFADDIYDPHGVPEYPDLTIAPSGTVFAAWSTTDAALWDNGAGTQNYYDAHFVYSPDGGTTWMGATGTLTLPIVGDDTGPAFTIENESNPVEFTPWGTTGYRGNWNLLQGLAYNQGELDFYYGGPTPSAHDAYARMNLPTRTIDERMSPYFGANGIEFDDAGGSFAESANASSTLYFVGAYYKQGLQYLGLVYSNDGGTTWYQGACSDSWSGPFAYINTARNLSSDPSSDGSVIGSFTATVNGETAVYFFRTSAL